MREKRRPMIGARRDDTEGGNHDEDDTPRYSQADFSRRNSGNGAGNLDDERLRRQQANSYGGEEPRQQLFRRLRQRRQGGRGRSWRLRHHLYGADEGDGGRTN